MVLIVIDTQAHTQRTIMVPLKTAHASAEPAQVIAYRPRS